MAHKAANGFIAPAPAHTDFQVVEHKRGGKEVYHSPSGVFVHGDHRVGVSMNYAGIDDSAWSTFYLPSDPDYLREIAAALGMMADQIDRARGR